MATANQTVTDLQAKIETLNAAPAQGAVAGEAPASNGTGVNAPKMVTKAFVWNSALTVEENMARKEAIDKELRMAALG